MCVFLQSEARFEHQLEMSRYLHVPVGNMPVAGSPIFISQQRPSLNEDGELPTPAPPLCITEFGCDLFYARHLAKQNHILWACGASIRPDFGGKEVDDQRLMLETEECNVIQFLVLRSTSQYLTLFAVYYVYL